jgi:hypothetical protein
VVHGLAAQRVEGTHVLVEPEHATDMPSHVRRVRRIQLSEMGDFDAQPG